MVIMTVIIIIIMIAPLAHAIRDAQGGAVLADEEGVLAAVLNLYKCMYIYIYIYIYTRIYNYIYIYI